MDVAARGVKWNRDLGNRGRSSTSRMTAVSIAILCMRRIRTADRSSGGLTINLHSEGHALTASAKVRPNIARPKCVAANHHTRIAATLLSSVLQDHRELIAHTLTTMLLPKSLRLKSAETFRLMVTRDLPSSCTAGMILKGRFTLSATRYLLAAHGQ